MLSRQNQQSAQRQSAGGRERVGFSRHYARFIGRFRWAILAFWLVAVAATHFFMPSLSNVVAHTPTNYVPNSSSVVVGQNLLNKVDASHSSKSTAVVAIHNPKGLTPLDKAQFASRLSDINSHRSKYGVESVQYIDNVNKQVASSFLSKDGTTEIALIGFPHSEVADQTSNSLTQLQSSFAGSVPSDAKVYFTGDAPIQLDDIHISQSGTSRTAVVTVILVLVILLLVFRSLIAPLVPLLSIGFAFLVSSSIVALLAKHGLPVSNFTQTFLIATLFGAGTDYSIILMNRFREELMREHGDRELALADTVRSVSKTVVFSGLTVLISFAILIFAKFGLYRSAVGVAVGIAVALITCLTLIPSLMSLLGPALFWPRKPRPGMAHAQSKFWLFTGRISARRPWWTLLALVIVLLPIALLFTNQRTFNPMDDIPNAPSVTGFNVVAKAFGPGNVLPSQIALHTTANLRTPAGLTTIENISQALAKQSSIHEVESATRPVGKVVTTFQLANQNQQAASGLAKAQAGLSKLQSGLAQAGGKLSSGGGGASQLTNGSKQVTSGASQVASGLGQLSKGAGKLSSGAAQTAHGTSLLTNNLQALATALQQVNQGSAQVASGVSQSAQAANQLAAGVGQLAQGSQQAAQAASSLANAIAAWAQTHPDTTNNPQWAVITHLAQADSQGTAQVSSAAEHASQGASQLSSGLSKLQSGSSQLNQGLNQAASGASKLATGSRQLSNGSQQVASGASSIATNAEKLSKGAAAVSSGSSQVTGGIETLTSSLGIMSPGLNQAVSGIGQVNHGVGQVKQFLQASGQASKHGNPGFYIPASTVSSNQSLLQAMNAYISPNGHTAKFTIVLNANPYSTKAISDIPGIMQAAQHALATSPISHGQLYATGTTPTQAELNSLSTQDFHLAVVLILSTIFILLVLMLRSILTPMYVILSLAGTYFITMGLLQTVTLHILHKPGISWPVPFFVFLLLVALGVDYCIFLMSRFEEEMASGMTPRRAMVKAMGHMGNVIFSAALIMAGTFGSMMSAGVSSLVEIGLAIVVGLLIYFAVILGFFVPASASVFNWGHFWPFVSDREMIRAKRRARREELVVE